MPLPGGFQVVQRLFDLVVDLFSVKIEPTNNVLLDGPVGADDVESTDNVLFARQRTDLPPGDF